MDISASLKCSGRIAVKQPFVIRLNCETATRNLGRSEEQGINLYLDRPVNLTLRCRLLRHLESVLMAKRSGWAWMRRNSGLARECAMTSPIRDTVRSHMACEEDRENHMVVLTALQASHYRPLWDLRCEVREGVVFLLGFVPSFFLKQVAQELLLQLGQFKEVRNLVEVYHAHAGEARIESAPRR